VRTANGGLCGIFATAFLALAAYLLIHTIIVFATG